MKRLKLWLLKRKLRRVFNRMNELEDDVTCGRALLSYFLPEYQKLQDEEHRLFAECQKLELTK